VLIMATLWFSLLTLLTGFAGSLTQLIVLRVLSGIGLGGIMPNVVALVGEYSPKRSRAFLMMFISNGFNVGAVVGGFVAAALVPEHGWRPVFYFGGALPLVIAALMLVFLPESLQFLALRGNRDSALRKWLSKVDPAVAGVLVDAICPRWSSRIRASRWGGCSKRAVASARCCCGRSTS
jgi:AAHS family 4-hydroxybenzoate transporter-like MFS transporter